MAERERCQGIRTAVASARLPATVADDLIARGLPLVEAQSFVFVELGKREDPNPAPNAGAGPIHVGEDPLVHVRKGIENAILHRVAPSFFKLEDIGRNYRGMTLLDIGRAFLQARGIRTTDLNKMELAGLALGLDTRGGMHTTSDFPLLMADVASKTLRAAYTEAPQTFKLIGRQVSLPDFKISNRMQLGDAPALLEVKEHGEFTRGTLPESKEALQLKTFGRIFAITRQALVNDDTDAFSRVPTAFGRAARTLESDRVWLQITSNPVMGDGVALFHASHGNLDAAPSVISVASLGKARAAMRVQKGIDGTTILNVNPKYLGLPAALETTAATFLVQITPATPANVNPFAGVLTPLVEPRLDANSANAWYLFAGDGLDVIEYAYLEGETGPTVESRLGFDIDGLEIKCRLDFDAKVIDWRGVWKNPGV
jgi:phage major head subunit gpT-like protein